MSDAPRKDPGPDTDVTLDKPSQARPALSDPPSESATQATEKAGMLTASAKPAGGGATEGFDATLDRPTGKVGPGPGNPASGPTRFDQAGGPGAVAPPDGAASAARYQILQFHAKGGMGQVWIAQDNELDREVALKEIQLQYAGDKENQQRFMLEARVTGRLEHPGIVPVYGLGRYPDGRPFYAMRFIKGQSLKEAIVRFHEADGPDRDPGQRAVELHRLVQHLINTCYAIAYAHSRGVLHRDLKPGNIMLGQYGETLVVDWGLALPLAAGEKTSNAAHLAIFPDDTLVREAGAVRGTVQYMSPEQSSGDVKRMGPASDVYSLGGILYCLLTDRDRFELTDVTAIVEQLNRGEFPPPRQVKADVPRALEAVCLKALALRPEDRYATPLELAADLEKWLADEPVSAWREPWTIRTRRWIGRHRTLVTASATAAVGLFLTLTAVGLVMRAAQRREDQRLAKIRGEAQELVYKGQAAGAVHDWANAKLFASNALAQIGDEPALADLKAAAGDLQGKTNQSLAELAKREQAQQQFAKFIQQRNEALFQYGTLFTSFDLKADLKATRQAILQALSLAGLTPNAREPIAWDEAYTNREKGAIAEGCYELLLILAEVTAQSVKQPEEPAGKETREEALAILDRAADLGGKSQAYHLRRARYLQQLGEANQARDELDRAQQVPPVRAVDYFLLGDERFRRGETQETVKAFDNALRVRPDHFWAQFFLAQYYLQAKRMPEAKAGLTACLTQRPEFPWLYVLRGMVQARADEFDQAEADFAQALERDPSAEARYLLLVYRGGMRGKQGKFAEAIADLQKAQSLMPHLHYAQEQLIHVDLRARRLGEAARLLEEALQRWPKEASLYALRARLGLAQVDLKAALRDCETALQLRPGSELDGALADDLVKFAEDALAKRRVADAAESAAAALRLRPDDVKACMMQLHALVQLGKHAQVIEVSNRFLEKGPAVADIFRLRAWSRGQLGDHLGAVDDLSRFLLAGTGVTSRGKLSPQQAAREAEVYNQRGWAYSECDAWAMSLHDFDRAVQLQPDNDSALNGRSLARAWVGQYREAIADAERALRLAPNGAVLTYNSACVYAMAVPKVAADAKEPDRERLAAAYRRRALELLAKAMKLHPEDQRVAYWRRVVQPDHAIDSIRKEPEFLKLAAEYAPSQP